MVLEIITEDESSNEADIEDLNTWADEYGLTMPVISDPASSYMWSIAGGGSVGLPFKVLLKEGVVIESVGDPYADVDEAVRVAGMAE